MADLTNSQGSTPVEVINEASGNTLALDSSGAITSNQGSANTIVNGWPIKITDGTNTQIVASNGASVHMDIVHYTTHLGLYFFFQDYATGIGNGSTRDILIITANNGKAVHSRFALATLGGTYVLYEGATTSANGTAITILNRNRTSANTPTVTAFFSPTVTTTGTQLAVAVLGSTSKATVDDVLNSDTELILKSNTKYLLRFTSSAGSNISAAGLNFYEV
jgi:hypothetical protein